MRCRVELDRVAEIRRYCESPAAEYRGFVAMTEPPVARIIEKPCDKIDQPIAAVVRHSSAIKSCQRALARLTKVVAYSASRAMRLAFALMFKRDFRIRQTFARGLHFLDQLSSHLIDWQTDDQRSHPGRDTKQPRTARRERSSQNGEHVLALDDLSRG